MSNSVRPHRQQPTRLSCPWDSPGKTTGVGCHFLLQCMKVKGESEVSQSCPTPSDPMNCSLPGFSVHGILQARLLEWVTFSFSRGSSQPTDQTWASHIGGRRSRQAQERSAYPEWISSLHRDRIQVSCIAGGGFFTTGHKLNQMTKMGFVPTHTEKTLS